MNRKRRNSAVDLHTCPSVPGPTSSVMPSPAHSKSKKRRDLSPVPNAQSSLPATCSGRISHQPPQQCQQRYQQQQSHSSKKPIPPTPSSHRHARFSQPPSLSSSGIISGRMGTKEQYAPAYSRKRRSRRHNRHHHDQHLLKPHRQCPSDSLPPPTNHQQISSQPSHSKQVVNLVDDDDDGEGNGDDERRNIISQPSSTSAASRRQTTQYMENIRSNPTDNSDAPSNPKPTQRALRRDTLHHNMYNNRVSVSVIQNTDSKAGPSAFSSLPLSPSPSLPPPLPPSVSLSPPSRQRSQKHDHSATPRLPMSSQSVFVGHKLQDLPLPVDTSANPHTHRNNARATSAPFNDFNMFDRFDRSSNSSHVERYPYGGAISSMFRTTGPSTTSQKLKHQMMRTQDRLREGSASFRSDRQEREREKAQNLVKLSHQRLAGAHNMPSCIDLTGENDEEQSLTTSEGLGSESDLDASDAEQQQQEQQEQEQQQQQQHACDHGHVHHSKNSSKRRKSQSNTTVDTSAVDETSNDVQLMPLHEEHNTPRQSRLKLRRGAKQTTNNASGMVDAKTSNIKTTAEDNDGVGSSSTFKPISERIKEVKTKSNSQNQSKPQKSANVKVNLQLLPINKLDSNQVERQIPSRKLSTHQETTAMGDNPYVWRAKQSNSAAPASKTPTSSLPSPHVSSTKNTDCRDGKQRVLPTTSRVADELSLGVSFPNDVSFHHVDNSSSVHDVDADDDNRNRSADRNKTSNDVDDDRPSSPKPTSPGRNSASASKQARDKTFPRVSPTRSIMLNTVSASNSKRKDLHGHHSSLRVTGAVSNKPRGNGISNSDSNTLAELRQRNQTERMHASSNRRNIGTHEPAILPKARRITMPQQQVDGRRRSDSQPMPNADAVLSDFNGWKIENAKKKTTTMGTATEQHRNQNAARDHTGSARNYGGVKSNDSKSADDDIVEVSATKVTIIDGMKQMDLKMRENHTGSDTKLSDQSKDIRLRSLTREEDKIWKSLTRVVKKSAPLAHVKEARITLRWKDFACLRASRWLNDEVMNSFVALINARNRAYFAHNANSEKSKEGRGEEAKLSRTSWIDGAIAAATARRNYEEKESKKQKYKNKDDAVQVVEKTNEDGVTASIASKKKNNDEVSTGANALKDKDNGVLMDSASKDDVPMKDAVKGDITNAPKVVGLKNRGSKGEAVGASMCDISKAETSKANVLMVDVDEVKKPKGKTLRPDENSCVIVVDTVGKDEAKKGRGHAHDEDGRLSIKDSPHVNIFNMPRPRTHVFNTFFFARLEQGGYDYGGVRRWLKKAGHHVKDLDLILVPINLSNFHWVMAAIDLRNRKFVYLDSMLRIDDHEVLKKLKQWLIDEVRDKLGDDVVRKLDITQWNCDSNPQYMPSQQDDGSCGIFSLYVAEYLERGMEPAFDQDDILNMRRRTALFLKQGKVPES